MKKNCFLVKQISNKNKLDCLTDAAQIDFNWKNRLKISPFHHISNNNLNLNINFSKKGGLLEYCTRGMSLL